MVEQLTFDSMLDKTDQLSIDWNALPTAYGLLRQFEITEPTLTVARITWADSVGEEHFWHGLLDVGLDATEDDPEMYAASVEWDASDKARVTLKPYFPAMHEEFIALSAMLEEYNEVIGMSPEVDSSDLTTPEWYTNMVSAYKAGMGQLCQAYLEMGHPQLAGQLEGLGIFDKVMDVEFISRAKIGE